MKTLFCSLIFFLIFFEAVLCWRGFWKGRKNGGNLGDPEKFKTDLGASDDNEDLWFTQKLDHSDPMNIKTWQQVSLFTSLFNYLHKDNKFFRDISLMMNFLNQMDLYFL